ncbi:hypothetical protein CANCADRAFT_22931 [Tortispora caseinolytica NRRL Y-17796]|uniref:Complex 1 LYR protein domain-containing protein n=1 Tax=Tortispora caseinolytica NRRL Y-17796 TaxID=767744 RepID=A0A1E4TLP4_9ASCO|nr:hypothetical protein CANCADRAFT_22931 [Tortispora caseinolytica NRRL Y-17796]
MQEAAKLYRNILRYGKKFQDYNFRSYIVRRTRDGFREHQHETDSGKIQALMEDGYKQLEVVKRQSVISEMYKVPEHLVVEQRH